MVTPLLLVAEAPVPVLLGPAPELTLVPVAQTTAIKVVVQAEPAL